MRSQLRRTSAVLAVAALLAAGTLPHAADAALTPEQSAALSEASANGSDALGTELGVQVLAAPETWPDLLAQALAIDPNSAAYVAALLALLLPTQAVEIATAAGGANDPLVVAAVAAAVPAATGALEETFGPIDPSNSAAASGHADKARDTKEASQRAASGGQRGGDGGLQNETSSLQDDGTPSPN